MYNVVVEWLDEQRSRAPFSLPGRPEWRAEHIDALIQVLAEIRSEMSPPVSQEPPQVHPDALHDPRYATELHPFSGGTLLEIRHPALGWTLVLLVVAIAGLPPFGLFVSEVLLIRAGLADGRPWMVTAVLALVGVAFVALVRHGSRMLHGRAGDHVPRGEAERWSAAGLVLPYFIWDNYLYIYQFGNENKGDRWYDLAGALALLGPASQPGDAAICAPGGGVLAEAMHENEAILYAEVDLSQVHGARRMLDVAGHYARPDVFQFGVRREPLPLLRSTDVPVKDEPSATVGPDGTAGASQPGTTPAPSGST